MRAIDAIFAECGVFSPHGILTVSTIGEFIGAVGTAYGSAAISSGRTISLSQSRAGTAGGPSAGAGLAGGSGARQ